MRAARPDATAARAAADRLAGLATPPGALGRLGELGVRLAGLQGVVPPRPVDRVRLVIFAGDHGVADHGVSAFPPAITGAMVRTFLAGRAGVSVLARQHDVAVRVLDLGVDEDFADLDPQVRAELGAHKVRRGSRPLHLTDALTADELDRSLAAGRAVAEEEIAAGADLLISGDMGIANTTPAAALVAALAGLPVEEVVGRGTGVDDAGLARKREVVQRALRRLGDRIHDPRQVLAALGSADLAATVGFMQQSAVRGVPVLLDGVISTACAVAAEQLLPGAAAWFVAGHLSPEPAHAPALKLLGLEPILDLGMRLGEGSGAVAAVPVVRSAVALLREVALLADLASEG